MLAGGGCTTLGELCSGDSGCCSGQCEDLDGSYRCTQPSVCRAEGDLCDEPADCCSGVCGTDGRCPELAECQTAGEPCTGSHECCSGLCTDPGTGTRVCQFVSGCRSIGEICMREEDCCGAICTEYASTGVFRCVKPSTPGCLFTGEVCGGATYGASNNCCPSGPDGGSQLCQPTVMGVTRCYGVGTEAQCLDDGETCTFADECCGGFCLPDADGDLFCGSTCVPLGDTCTTSADCCSDMVCEGGVCEPNAFGCLPIGDPCTEHNECCSGACINDCCQEPPV